MQASDDPRVDAPGPASRADASDPDPPRRRDRVLEVDVVHLHVLEAADPADDLPCQVVPGAGVHTPRPARAASEESPERHPVRARAPNNAASADPLCRRRLPPARL